MHHKNVASEQNSEVNGAVKDSYSDILLCKTPSESLQKKILNEGNGE